MAVTVQEKAKVVADYQRLFAKLDPQARAKIVAAWGAPDADSSVSDGHFTMRFARHGRLIAAIQPDRGNALDRKSRGLIGLILCSRVHLKVGQPPMMRKNGEIRPIDGLPVLGAEDAQALIYSMLADDQRARFEADWELDCSYEVRGLSRFRVNVLMSRNGVEAVLRIIGASEGTAWPSTVAGRVA